MKVLRNSLILALLSSAPALAVPIPADLAGSYQALLYSQDLDAGSPSGLVTLAVTTKGAVTGKLTTAENKTYPFKTTLDYIAANTLVEDSPLGTASAPAITISRGKNVPAWSLTLRLQDFAENDTLEVVLNQDETTFGSTNNGFKQITFAKGALPYAAAGAYTVAFELADTPGQNDPAGSGYAVGSIDAKGLLKLTGKTGDGTVFTAALPAGPDYRYVTFLNPYKRINSFFAGKITLTEREGNGFHMTPAEAGYDFQWKKSSLLPKITDKSYREGFGPLDVLVLVEPWTAPGKGQTVGSVFGIDPKTEAFEINFGFNVPAARKPTLLTLDTKNALKVVQSSVYPAPADFTKIFSGKVDPKTGKLTATLNLEDTFLAAGKLKVVKRKVVIEGVLIAFEGSSTSFATGFGLVPPLDAKLQTTTSGGITFENIQDEPLIAALTEANIDLGGNYQGVFDWDNTLPNPPSTIPAHQATVPFSISEDLQTLTFNGRKLLFTQLTLAGGYNDIIFKDIKNVKNSVVATIRFNSSGLIKCDVTYFELVGFSARFRNALSRNNPSNTLIKLP